MHKFLRVLSKDSVTDWNRVRFYMVAQHLLEEMFDNLHDIADMLAKSELLLAQVCQVVIIQEQ